MDLYLSNLFFSTVVRSTGQLFQGEAYIEPEQGKAKHFYLEKFQTFRGY